MTDIYSLVFNLDTNKLTYNSNSKKQVFPKPLRKIMSSESGLHQFCSVETFLKSITLEKLLFPYNITFYLVKDHDSINLYWYDIFKIDENNRRTICELSLFFYTNYVQYILHYDNGVFTSRHSGICEFQTLPYEIHQILDPSITTFNFSEFKDIVV